MKRVALAALLQIAWAAPVVAQMDPSMPGMSMPAETTPTAKAGPAPAKIKAYAGTRSSNPRASGPKKNSSAPKTGQGVAGTPGMSMPGTRSSGMANMPGMSMRGSLAARGEQNIPQTPPPPPPRDHAADWYYDPAAMAEARSGLREDHGGQIFSKVFGNLMEFQPGPQGGGYRWDGEAWIGGDINRLWLKSEGEGTRRGGVDSAEIQALYSRAIDPYTDLQFGVRYDFKPNPSRIYATAGFETLFPYWFQVEGGLFLSNKGELLARVEGYYDLFLTQQFVLQPRAELNLSAQNSHDINVGAGFSNAELSLRLRYEIRREFAPYVGVTYTQSFGTTANYERASGKDTGTVRFVTGLRSWF